jgi:SAM-dependent methyltransferase
LPCAAGMCAHGDAEPGQNW